MPSLSVFLKDMNVKNVDSSGPAENLAVLLGCLSTSNEP